VAQFVIKKSSHSSQIYLLAAKMDFTGKNLTHLSVLQRKIKKGGHCWPPLNFLLNVDYGLTNRKNTVGLAGSTVMFTGLLGSG
jgi:hypothetical protein